MNRRRGRDENERDRSRAGFTLVEVMLVVIIIGILATVVTVQFRGQGRRAKINTTRTSIQNLCTAVDMYELSVEQLPGSLADLAAPLGEDPPLLKSGVPKDAWGIDFQYSRKGDMDFEVRSAGPDATMGTGDDLTN